MSFAKRPTIQYIQHGTLPGLFISAPVAGNSFFLLLYINQFKEFSMRKTLWFQRSLRRLLVDMHIPDWNDEEFLKDFQPENYGR